jgi:ATP synthase protein I
MSEDRKEDDAELAARLAKLGEAIKAREARDAAERAPQEPTTGSAFAKAMSAGFSVFSEFVGALVVGGVIGWQIDVWTGAKPWGLVTFLGLGAAAGFWNIYRLATRQASQAAASENSDAN